MTSPHLLMVCVNFPDPYHPYLAPWNATTAAAIAASGATLEVVVPRPYVPPISGVPYAAFNRLPSLTTTEGPYTKHYPRFLWLEPKRLLFAQTGDLYRRAMESYLPKAVTRPDVVHARFVYVDGYGVSRLAQAWEAPLVVDVHGNNDFGAYLQWKGVARRVRETLDRAAAICCVADFQVDAGMKAGIPREKLVVNAIGVDPAPFDGISRAEARARLGWREEEVVLLTVGQLISRKRVDWQLRAIARGHKQEPHIFRNVKLVVVGSGPDENTLKRGHTGVGEALFAGKVSSANLHDMLAAADVFLLSSSAEGRPVAIYEAMAAGLPTVATAAGGVPEQVVDGYSGWVVPVDDEDAFYRAIRDACSDENERRRRGREARRRLDAMGWTLQGYGRRAFATYRRLLG